MTPDVSDMITASLPMLQSNADEQGRSFHPVSTAKAHARGCRDPRTGRRHRQVPRLLPQGAHDPDCASRKPR